MSSLTPRRRFLSEIAFSSFSMYFLMRIFRFFARLYRRNYYAGDERDDENADYRYLPHLDFKPEKSEK